MAVDIGARIKVDGEAAYNQQITQIIKQQKELKAAMQGTEAAFAADASNKEKSAARTKNLTAQLTTANAKLKAQKEELQRLEAAGQGASAKADTLRVAIAKTEAEVAKLNKELRQNSGMVAFGKDLQEAGEKMQSVGGKLSSFGTTMTKSVTAPLAAAGAMAVKLATEFETAMAKLNSIADTSETSLDSLRNQIMSLSEQTGISASELAEQTYQAISAGQDTASSVRFVAETTKLAKAGFAETGNALDVLTTILNAYGKKTSETAKVSDILITTQNLGKTTVAQLSENMGQAIPTAAAYSVDLENVASAYVTLTKQGINTANATTQINGLMNQLGKSGTVASNALKDKTGKTFKELMASGSSLSDVLMIVKEAAEENGVSLNDMFGNVRAGRAAMAIMNDEGVTFSNSLQAMAQAAGATSVAFDKVTNTTAYKFEVALNKVKNTGIEAGQQLLITFAPAIEKIGNAITKAVESFSNMSNAEQQAIIKTAAFAAGIGPAVLALGKLTTGVGRVTSGVGSLIEKWGLLGQVPAAGIAGIVGAFVGLSAILAKVTYDAEKYAGEFGKVVRESEKVNDSTAELRKNIASTSDAYKDNTSKIQSNADQANKLVDDLEKLSQKTNRTAAENRQMATTVDTLNSLYPGLALSIDTNTGKLSQNTSQIRENIKSLSEQAMAIAAQERAVEINKQLLDIEAQIVKVEAQKKEALAAAEEARRKEAQAAEAGLNNYATAVTETSLAAGKLTDDLDALKKQEKELKGDLNTANAYLDEHSDALNETSEAAEEGAGYAELMAENLEAEAAAAEEAAQKIADGAKLQVGAFDEVQQAATKSIQDIIKGLRSQIDAQQNYSKNLQTLYKYIQSDTGRNWDAVVKIIQDGGINLAGELQGIVDAIEQGDTELLNELAGLTQGVNDETEKSGKALVQLSDTTKTAFQRAREAAVAEKPRILSEAKAIAQGVGTNFSASMKSSGTLMYTDTATGVKKAAQGIKDQAPNLNKTAKTAGAEGAGNVAAGARSKNAENQKAGGEAVDNARAGINAKVGALKQTGSAAGSAGGQAVIDAMRAKRRGAEEAGEYISLGLAKGINNKARDVNAAASNVANIAIKTMKNVPQVSSPSKVTTEIGEYIAEGLIVGMMNRIQAVKAEAAEVARAALPNVGNTMMDITGQTGLDPDEMYAAVREGASDATQNIYLNGRDLTRGLKGLGVSFTNG